MDTTIQDEMDRGGFPIKTILDKKHGDVRLTCERIIEYLIDHRTIENQGWVRSIDLWKFCNSEGIHSETVRRQLKDLFEGHIIDRHAVLIRGFRGRPGKKKENVFYRISPVYSPMWNQTSEEWMALLNGFNIAFGKIADKLDITRKMLQEEGVKNADEEIERRLHILDERKKQYFEEQFSKMGIRKKEEIIKSLSAEPFS